MGLKEEYAQLKENRLYAKEEKLSQMKQDLNSGKNGGHRGEDLKELDRLKEELKEDKGEQEPITQAKERAVKNQEMIIENKKFDIGIKQDVQNDRNSEIDRRYEELNDRAENETQELKTPEKDEISEEQIQNALEKITSIATADVVPGAGELLKEAFVNAKQEQEQTLGNAEVANEHSPFSNHEEQKQQEERVEQDDSLAIEQARGGR